jgi:hypothetical protein
MGNRVSLVLYNIDLHDAESAVYSLNSLLGNKDKLLTVWKGYVDTLTRNTYNDFLQAVITKDAGNLFEYVMCDKKARAYTAKSLGPGRGSGKHPEKFFSVARNHTKVLEVLLRNNDDIAGLRWKSCMMTLCDKILEGGDPVEEERMWGVFWACLCKNNHGNNPEFWLHIVPLIHDKPYAKKYYDQMDDMFNQFDAHTQVSTLHKLFLKHRTRKFLRERLQFKFASMTVSCLCVMSYWLVTLNLFEKFWQTNNGFRTAVLYAIDECVQLMLAQNVEYTPVMDLMFQLPDVMAVLSHNLAHSKLLATAFVVHRKENYLQKIYKYQASQANSDNQSCPSQPISCLPCTPCTPCVPSAPPENTTNVESDNCIEGQCYVRL